MNDSQVMFHVRSCVSPIPSENTDIGNKKKSQKRMSLALTGRLTRYREIVENAQKEGKHYVSSDTCGRELHVDGTLVRKDMACLGVSGKPHVGYPVSDILEVLDRLIREQTQRAAVLVGAGNMGTALIQSGTLQRHGVHLEGVFDTDSGKIGTFVGRHKIDPLSLLAQKIEETGARLGVVTVPAGAAQGTIDLMIKEGICVIWNFAPIRPHVPQGIKVLNEHLAGSVGKLSRYLEEMDMPARTAAQA